MAVNGYPCPFCPKVVASSEWHLRRHLEGKTGIHRLSTQEADKIIYRIEHPDIPSVAPTKPSEPLKLVTAETPEVRYERPADPYAAFISDLFEQLVTHKELPKYQFERRIDAIVALFLPEIFRCCLGWEVEVVVPEFPIKKADNNQSTNVDYLLFRRSGQQGEGPAWIFFELKTDCGSLRPEQWDVYLDASRRGMLSLRKGLDTIAAATKQSAKYRELLRKLQDRDMSHPIEIVYLSPGGGATYGMSSEVRVISFQQLRDVCPSVYSEVWDLFQSIVLPKLC